MYFAVTSEMSKQRGKGFRGGRRKCPHKDDRDLKQHSTADQHKMKFDEDRFLRDMESALGCMISGYSNSYSV